MNVVLTEMFVLEHRKRIVESVGSSLRLRSPSKEAKKNSIESLCHGCGLCSGLGSEFPFASGVHPPKDHPGKLEKNSPNVLMKPQQHKRALFAHMYAHHCFCPPAPCLQLCGSLPAAPSTVDVVR